MSDNTIDTLRRINSEVNNTRKFTKGLAGWQLDYLPPGGNGDCDSFAMTKIEELKKAGVPQESIYLSSYKLWDGQDHTVVRVNHGDKDYYLDNRLNDYTHEPPGKLLNEFGAGTIPALRPMLVKKPQPSAGLIAPPAPTKE